MDATTVTAISFVAYSLLIIATGLYSTKLKKNTVADFILANRELGPVTAALSASASAESGWVMLGLVGEAYLYGAAAFWIIPGIAAGYLFNWFVLAERLRKATFDSGAATLPQYILHRFGPKSAVLRFIPVIIITLAMLGYVAAQMNAAGKAFHATFDLDYSWGVLAGAAIILAYTIWGGFRAVCWTDVVQASFMFIALIGMPIIVLFDIGGFSVFVEKAKLLDPQILTFSYGKVGHVLFWFVVGLLGIGLGYPGQPHVLSRYMAAKDSKSVKQGGTIALVWMVVVYLGAIFFGLFAKVYFGEIADPEQALPLAVNAFLPPILGGFVIAAIVSAICSTADSQLIVMSTTISRDVLPLFTGEATDDQHDYQRVQNYDRWVLIILAVISILFAISQNRVIFEFVLYAWSVLGAGFGPVVALGLLWKRTNKSGAIAGMLTGMIVSIVWRNIPQLKAIVYELVPAFFLALLATIIFSLITSSKEKQA